MTPMDTVMLQFIRVSPPTLLRHSLSDALGARLKAFPTDPVQVTDNNVQGLVLTVQTVPTAAGAAPTTLVDRIPISNNAVSICSLIKAGADYLIRYSDGFTLVDPPTPDDPNDILYTLTFRDTAALNGEGFWRRFAASLARSQPFAGSASNPTAPPYFSKLFTSYANTCRIGTSIARMTALMHQDAPLAYSFFVDALGGAQTQLPIVIENDNPGITDADFLYTGSTVLALKTVDSFNPLIIETVAPPGGGPPQQVLKVATKILFEYNYQGSTVFQPLVRVRYSSFNFSVSNPQRVVKDLSAVTTFPASLAKFNGGKYVFDDSIVVSFQVFWHPSTFPVSHLSVPSWTVWAICTAAGLILGYFQMRKMAGIGNPGIFRLRPLWGFAVRLLGWSGTGFFFATFVYYCALLFNRTATFATFFIWEEYKIILWCAFAMEGAYYLYRRAVQVFQTTYLILDWEAESVHAGVNKYRRKGDKPTGWRKIWLLSYLRRLYSMRYVSWFWTVVCASFLLFGLDAFYLGTGGPDPTWYPLYSHFLYSKLVIGGLLALVGGSLLILRRVVLIFLKNPFELLGTYAALANCSLLCFDGPTSGYIVHGENPAGTGEVPYEVAMDMLERERQGMLRRMGLRRDAGIQFARFFFDPALRLDLVCYRFLLGLVQHRMRSGKDLLAVKQRIEHFVADMRVRLAGLPDNAADNSTLQAANSSAPAQASTLRPCKPYAEALLKELETFVRASHEDPAESWESQRIFLVRHAPKPTAQLRDIAEVFGKRLLFEIFSIANFSLCNGVRSLFDVVPFNLITAGFTSGLHVYKDPAQNTVALLSARKALDGYGRNPWITHAFPYSLVVFHVMFMVSLSIVLCLTTNAPVVGVLLSLFFELLIDSLLKKIWVARLLGTNLVPEAFLIRM